MYARVNQRIGKYIFKRRKKKGLTQVELAKMANISRFTLIRIEKKGLGANLENSIKIMHALGASVGRFEGYLKRSNHEFK